MINAERMLRCSWEYAGAAVKLKDVGAAVPKILDGVKVMDIDTFSEELDKAIDSVSDAMESLSDVRAHLIATKKEWINRMCMDSGDNIY